MMDILIEDQVKEFIRRLPPPTMAPPSVHLLMLAARSRLAKHIHGVKIKDIVVERNIIRATDADWRAKYFTKVYNLAVLQSQGRYYFNDNLISEKALAIFATLSPRNVYSSVVSLMKDIMEYLYQRDVSANMQVAKTHVLFFGALHKHKSRDYNFYTLDIDDASLFKSVREEVSSFNVFMTLKTSRGYHIILDLSNPNHARDFYQGDFLSKLRLKYPEGLELQKDAQEPVAGTRYYKHNGDLNYVRLVE